MSEREKERVAEKGETTFFVLVMLFNGGNGSL